MLFGVVVICNSSVACEGTNFALLRSDQLANAQEGFCSRPGLAGIVKPWRVSCADVKAAERQLPRFLAGLNTHVPLQNLRRGFRQYLGFERAGKRFLFINHVPEDNQIPRSVSVRRVRDVCDGGMYVWSVEFAVATATFDHFQTSGPDAFPDNAPPPFLEKKIRLF